MRLHIEKYFGIEGNSACFARRRDIHEEPLMQVVSGHAWKPPLRASKRLKTDKEKNLQARLLTLWIIETHETLLTFPSMANFCVRASLEARLANGVALIIETVGTTAKLWKWSFGASSIYQLANSRAGCYWRACAKLPSMRRLLHQSYP